MDSKNNANKIAILGSTGSIGKNAIDIVRKNPSRFYVHTLVAKGSDMELIVDQCKEFNPQFFFISNKEIIEKVYDKLEDYNNNFGGIIKTSIMPLDAIESTLLNEKFDITVAAMSGFAGVIPTVYMSERSKKLAIANKEVIVCGWPILKNAADKNRCSIIPVDSEHNALFQLLLMSDFYSDTESVNNKKNIDQLVITASGGPFLNYKGSLENVTLDMALNHPKWKMGKKNSIDSATMANKGLEIIEACFLFDMPEEKVEAVIHPQAIMHGAILWKDGSSFAFLSEPDMRIHIANAILNDFNINNGAERLNFTKVGKLDFIDINYDKFPIIGTARSAIKEGFIGTLVFSVANEIAVNLFLEQKIKFTQISLIVQKAVENCIKEIKNQNLNSIEKLIEINENVTYITNKICETISV